jgi:hypothetical protein
MVLDDLSGLFGRPPAPGLAWVFLGTIGAVLVATPLMLLVCVTVEFFFGDGE